MTSEQKHSPELTEKIDGYEQFFELFPKKEFFKFGLEHTLTAPIDEAREEWHQLVKKVNLKEGPFYVRSSGRNGRGNDTIKELYKQVFGIDILFDLTNNQKPTLLLQKLRKQKKNVDIFNYQVSHVFGRTKNVFCFTAPWNIVFIPKILDPFTGHEAKGPAVDEFKKLFEKRIYTLFEKEIKEYNTLMKKYRLPLATWVEKNVDLKLQESIKKDFLEIHIS